MPNGKTLPQVVIIGAGFAGLNAAKNLGKAPVRVTVIDKSNYHLFQPLLYQVATAGLSPADIAAPIRNILRNQKNTEVLMGKVTGIDLNARNVLLSDRAINYDYLIIATGATHSYFGREDWQKFAPGLKSIENATTIRRKILLAFESAEMEADPEKHKELLTFIIVGGGPTGVEVAGSIAELAHVALASDFRHIDPKSARILLVEAGARILASFPEDLSKKAQRALERLGVEVRTNARVDNVSEEGVSISGAEIRSKTVLWAAGVIASPAGKWLAAEVDRAGRVKVLPDLSLPGHPHVFVIGDTAHATDSNGTPLPGLAPVAIQQGKYVASAILQKIKGVKELPSFYYLDKGNLATIGRSQGIAVIRSLHLSGFVAWLTWLVVHIFYLIGFKNRLVVMVQWAWAYFTFQRGARLITTDENLS
ncbi:MAG: NAD(P)/FAD-dependent oxidoreductase [Bdellovibrionota bacterium]